MPKFRVYAKVISYAYIDIDAKNQDEAEEEADKLDGGDFTPCERGGEFIVAPSDIPTQKVTKKLLNTKE